MIYILDSAAFMNLGSFGFEEEAYIITRLVEAELKDSQSKQYLDSGKESGKIKLQDPLPEYMEKAKSAAKESTDYPDLSEADFSVIALAIQFKEENIEYQLLTDDYSVQNVAEHIGLNYDSLAHEKIKEKITWVWRCPKCRKTYQRNTDTRDCPDCEEKLEKKKFK
ncbi:MAG: hypothetical protein JXA43_02530 [Candidatus Diapherotrites archaeon]|nr:hypothetical protein [Candidatus Diapherotrites archaeon]